MFKRILIALVPGRHTVPMIRPGLALAHACQASVVFFSAADRPQAEKLHQQAQQLAAGLGLATRSVIAAAAPTTPSLLNQAAASCCDLIVLAHEGGNAMTRLLGGSAIPRLITSSPVPVMVCPPQSEHTTASGSALARILVMLEDDSLAELALNNALALAGPQASELLFIHRDHPVTSPMLDAAGVAMGSSCQATAEMQRQAHALVARSRRAAAREGLVAQGLNLPAGATATDIASIAAGRASDLIVLAHHPDNAVTRLLGGSLIPGLITAAAAPLLIYRTPR